MEVFSACIEHAGPDSRVLLGLSFRISVSGFRVSRVLEEFHGWILGFGVQEFTARGKSRGQKFRELRLRVWDVGF